MEEGEAYKRKVQRMRDDAFARMTGEHLFKEHDLWTEHHHETASFQSCERASNKIQSNPQK